MFVAESNALTFRQNGVEYYVTSVKDLTLMVVKSSQDYYGDVIIPENVVYNDKTFTVTEIDSYTFTGCSLLTSLSIPRTVLKIGIQLFNGDKSLKEIKVDKDNPNFCDVDGVLFSKDTTVMYYYPTAKSTIYQLPNETKIIRESCFNVAWNLANVAFNEGLEEIDIMSFYYVKLTQLEFPSSLKKIGDGAFSRSTEIKKIYCKSATPPICDNPFDAAIYLNAILYVPIGSLEKYQEAKGWENFYTIQEYDVIAFANTTVAKNVSNLIDAIATVEYSEDCKARIEAARSAYEALTEEQKALVSNLDILITAQQTYETLKAAAEKLAADKAVFDKYKSEIMAIIEALAKEDDSDAVMEIIRKAISDIDALEYEEAISLDDNKAKVQSFVTSVSEAVENQRIEDQKPNGIEKLEFAERYNIYDLNGIKLSNSTLKSGVYINNGKKIIVK